MLLRLVVSFVNALIKKVGIITYPFTAKNTTYSKHPKDSFAKVDFSIDLLKI